MPDVPDLEYFADRVNRNYIVVVVIESKLNVAMTIRVSNFLVWTGARLRRKCNCALIIYIDGCCFLHGGVQVAEVDALDDRVLASTLTAGVQQAQETGKQQC